MSGCAKLVNSYSKVSIKIVAVRNVWEPVFGNYGTQVHHNWKRDRRESKSYINNPNKFH